MKLFRGTPKKRQKGEASSTADSVESFPDDITTQAGNRGSAPTTMPQDTNEVAAASSGAPPKDASYYKKQLKTEKAGKRKLFHALVKLAEDIKRVKSENQPLRDQAQYANQNWYEGGIWRAPQLLPGVDRLNTGNMLPFQRTRLRQAVSLSDLFFSLVIVTAFTRVGVAITNSGQPSGESVLYFAVFWIIWSKEESYSTRFDNTDLSAKVITLLKCFAVLFASLSVSSAMQTTGATRIMFMSAFCSLMQCVIMARVYIGYMSAEQNTVEEHVRHYALFNTIMNLIESGTWCFGIFFSPVELRWLVFTIGVLLGLRMPRAFLSNDFHAANTKRGVLFILLLGFMLQTVVVVSTDFFEYTAPDWEQYSFIGASCLLLFCIKLLYVDDSNVLASDHALLVNRAAGLFFNLGQFALLFSTTILGSGLNLLTHSYLAAAAALPGPAKDLVCAGFGGVLLSTAFIKSMHLKRVPRAAPQKAIFIGAYVVQLIATIAIALVCLAMCYGHGGYLQVLMQNDVELMWVLSGFAVFLVALSMLDEGLELALHDPNGEEGDGTGSVAGGSDDYLVHPFGFWCCCLRPEVDMEEILLSGSTQQASLRQKRHSSGARLSELSPLLGESIANMRVSGVFSQNSSSGDFGSNPGVV